MFVVFISFQVLGLTCSSVKTLGSGAKFSLEELKSLSSEDVLSCLTYLGRDPLGVEESRYLWMKILEVIDK